MWQNIQHRAGYKQTFLHPCSLPTPGEDHTAGGLARLPTRAPRPLQGPHAAPSQPFQCPCSTSPRPASKTSCPPSPRKSQLTLGRAKSSHRPKPPPPYLPMFTHHLHPSPLKAKPQRPSSRARPTMGPRPQGCQSTETKMACTADRGTRKGTCGAKGRVWVAQGGQLQGRNHKAFQHMEPGSKSQRQASGRVSQAGKGLFRMPQGPCPL